MDRTRREFLAVAGIVPIVAMAATAASAAEPVCYDPAAIGLSQRNRRRAISFVEQSGDPARQCSLCAFFHAQTGECGTCDMLGGGQVTARGVCTAFAKKPR